MHCSKTSSFSWHDCGSHYFSFFLWCEFQHSALNAMETTYIFITRKLCVSEMQPAWVAYEKNTHPTHTHTREHYYYYNGSLKNALCVCERQIEREWNCCGAVGGACNRKNSWNIWLCGRGALMHQRVRIHSHQFISIQIYLSTFGSERETRFWAIIIEEPRSLIECQQVNWLFLIYKHQQKTFT